MNECVGCGNKVFINGNVCPYCGLKNESILISASASNSYSSAPKYSYAKASSIAPQAASYKSSNVSSSNSSLQPAIKIIMVLCCILCVLLIILNPIYLVAELWVAPMTIHYFVETKKHNNVGIGFKVCTLLFVSRIAGILMFCDSN